MAGQISGYRVLAPNQYDSYEHFKQLLLNNGVDVDYSWGNQCWDAPALLWYQYGLFLRTGPNHAVYECWTVNRETNAQPPFTLINDKTQIKKGDIVVFNANAWSSVGHIGFADENWTGGTRINILGQNEGQGTAWGTPSIVTDYSTSWILGAFRNTDWKSPVPPTPVVTTESKRFPWILYANKLRKRF